MTQRDTRAVIFDYGNVLVRTLDPAPRADGLQVALLSNFSTELHAFLSMHALQHRFDPIAISADVGVMKPDTEAYQTVLDRLALPANACVFVDDLAANVVKQLKP